MKRFLLLIPILLFFGCSSEKERLHDEVMAIHDEVMPKMDDLMKESARLKSLKENENDSLKKIKIDQALVQLKNADDSMMEWMRAFKPAQFENDDAALIEYYNQEKNRIELVKESTNEALELSRSIQ